MNRKSMGTPSGFRDLLPKDVQLKRWLVGIIEDVYKKYGFLPIETPIVEFHETLAGDVTDFNLYKIVPSKERQKGVAKEMALRFDQTVPLARFVVDNMNNITLPFKRYVYGPVFRGETPQAGRYRQFDQFDMDIVGSSNIASDIEIILCMCDVMRAVVGNQKFVIKTNTRKLLNCLPKLFDFPEEKLRSVLIELDKRDKIPTETLRESLVLIGLTESNATRMIDFGSVVGSPNDVLSQIKVICGHLPEAEEAINDLEAVALALKECSAVEVQFDMAVIRGLAYYTAMVFETSLVDAPQFGSVYSGGRYDGLVESFGVQPLPAVGASVGVDRLIAALQSLNFVVPDQEKKVIVLVQDVSCVAYAFKIGSIIRSLGMICEVYTGNKKKLADQFKYTDKLGYSYSVVVGLAEMQDNVVNIKNQKTKEQSVILISSLRSSHFGK